MVEGDEVAGGDGVGAMMAIKKVRRGHDDCCLASGVERKAKKMSRFFVPLSLSLI